MVKLKPFLDFFLFSNLFVAISFSALSFQTFKILYAPPDYSLLLFVFSSSLFVYTFHRWFCISKLSPDQKLPGHLEWSIKNKKFLILIFALPLILIFYSSFQLLPSQVIVLIPVAIISLGYTLPVIPGGGGNISLREIPGLKSFFIAFVVSFITVVLPVIAIRQKASVADVEILSVFLVRFFFIFALAIPFDIRDLVRDKEKQIKTIPVLLGERRAKFIALLSLLLSAAICFFQIYEGVIAAPVLISILVSLVLSGVLIFFSSPSRSENYFSIWMDGMMVFQTILVQISILF